MNTRMEQMIAHFKAQYSSIVSEPNHKFTMPLSCEEEIKAKLCAAYEVWVEWRGCHVEWSNETKSCIDNVVTWLYDKHRWLILSGTLGNGKTTMLKALRTIFPTSVYYTANYIFDSFKNKESLPVIPNDKMLLLDDVGAEPPLCKIFGEDRAPITDLLLHRYDKLSTTIIATNLSIEDFQKRYGDRLADRIVELGIVIKNDAPSYRGR